MTEYRDKHLAWARKYLADHDPQYRFRWEVYFDQLESCLQDAKSFLDAGCGANETVSDLEFDGFKLGIDLARRGKVRDYCCGDLARLPFASESFDLVGCRFVLEHLPEPVKVFAEFARILVPGGFVLTQTTNKYHPLVFLGRLLPRSIKRTLTRAIYGCSGGTDYKTFHRFNRPRDFRLTCGGLVPVRQWCVEDLHLESKPAFHISYAYHQLTGKLRKPHWRSSITTLWQKPGGSLGGNAYNTVLRSVDDQ